MSVYRKHFIPLESNPEVFTQLMNDLGVPSLQFQDVLSLDDPFLFRTVFALILVLPTTDAYERQSSDDEANRQEYVGRGNKEDVVWFKQTINNACGLYAVLHAVSNGKARSFIGELPSYINWAPPPPCWMCPCQLFDRTDDPWSTIVHLTVAN